MFLQAGNSLFGTGASQPSDIQDLFMCESYFDEYTNTGPALDSNSGLQQQLQQQQQQLIQQLNLQQHQQQQQQQQPQHQQPPHQPFPLELQLQSFLASNAAQQQQLQQQLQQQQLQAQQEQQQLLLNQQAQLAALRWALAQSTGNAAANTNAASLAAATSATVTSPADSAAFFNSPDLMASLSPQSDTLMLPISPGAVSSNEDGSMLSPLLLSSQVLASSPPPSSALTLTPTPTAIAPTKVRVEKAKTAKRHSVDDGTDIEANAGTTGTSTKRTKKTASTKTTAPASKKLKAKKNMKTGGSDQSDMEMSVSASMSTASTTPPPQTLSLPLPTSLTLGTSGVTSVDLSATASLFQPLAFPIASTPAVTSSPSAGILPFWKMASGVVLPPTMPLPSTSFDPSAFTGGIVPTVDVSANTSPVQQQTPVSAQPGQPQPVQQKVPITRLKPPQALVTPPPIPTTSQGVQPTKQQKKVAHNAIERRYRNNINDRISDLKNVVPALCNIKTKDEKDDDDDEEPEDADGVARATKLNKATILRKATEYIIVLQRRESGLKSENTTLRKLLASLPGGIDLLEQHQAELNANQEEGSPIPESSSEDSSSEPTTPPPTSSSSPGATRVLMAFFMCATLFTSPEGKEGLNRAIMDDGQGAGRAMSSNSFVQSHNAPILNGGTGSGSILWGPFSVAEWNTWAAVRALIFMGCLLALVWPTYSRRGPFAQSKFPAMPKSFTPVQVYSTLSGLVPKTIPSSYFRLFFALLLELWRCLWIRLGIYPDLTDMVRPDIWARLVESQLSGGAGGATVSRFMVLYTIVRTLDEYTNARRQPPARVSATAALAFYISLRRAAKPLATLVAQQFMESARWTAKISGIGQDRWLESMLQVEVGSAAWNRSILEIESTMYGRAEYPQTNAILFQTMAPTLVVAQTQSVSVLQDAYVACMSRLNSATTSVSVTVAHEHTAATSAAVGNGRVARFDDVVRTTLPGTRHHWYALVGKISELWLANDEQSAQLGDRLMGQVMAMHPRHHLTTKLSDHRDDHDVLHHQLHHRHPHHHHHHHNHSHKETCNCCNINSDSNINSSSSTTTTTTKNDSSYSGLADSTLQAEQIESSFQYYDQVIVYSLLEYAYLRRGMAGPSVRCGEKAWSLLNEKRPRTTPLAPLHSSMVPSETEEDNDKALLGVAYFAMNLTGFVQVKARIGLWRGVEALSTLIKNSSKSPSSTTPMGSPENMNENEDMSQSEILDHIRTTLMPLTVHLRRQLSDESTTMLAMMQVASGSTRNKVRRPPVIDFDSALRFLIDIGRVAYGAWEDGSESSDSGCSSGGEEEEDRGRTMLSTTPSQKAALVTKKSDAERAWEICHEL